MERQRIVVGIDGSVTSRDALRWAFEEAKVRKAELHVVTAWTYPYLLTAPGVVAPAIPTTQLEEAAATIVQEALDAVVGAGDPDVVVTTAVAEGPAATVLVDAAKDADLLVMGSRGRGGFRGMLLGSVSQSVAHHAPCPLVIIRHTEEED